MPLINSNFIPSFLFKNGHVSTIYSGLFRRVNGVNQKRERIFLSDGDFLDLDWSYAPQKTDKLIIILHGLEGDAQRPYMLGTAKLFNANEYDALCINFRGCSEEENTLYRSYHSGATKDIVDVIGYITKEKHYSDIFLKGFSLGGNIVLKYLGEGNIIPHNIKGAVVVSVPCHLSGSAKALHKFENTLYAKRFLRYLIKRLKKKQYHFPEEISAESIASIKTLYDFDNVYTAFAHGFKNAEDYYEKSSSLQFLENIKIPTLILNAQNDSFLSKECYPLEIAKTNQNLYLEMPKYGGHVGFWSNSNVYYNEQRALEFLGN